MSRIGSAPGARMTVRDISRFQPAIVIGAALAGVAYGATGFVALLDTGPDPGPAGSTSFYLIEGGHALAESGMVVALIGLWRSHRPISATTIPLSANACPPSMR